MITNWFDDDPLFTRYYPDNPTYRSYFENEWGIPSHNDRQLFEMLSLSGFAAGLNWQVVLNKRHSFYQAFAHWQIDQIAQMTPTTVQELLHNPAIIRNPRKINAVVHNANVVQRLIHDYGSFDQYLWQQVDSRQLILEVAHFHDLPRRTLSGDRMSKCLRAAGFKFAGPITVHAWMVTTGFITARLDQKGILPQKKRPPALR
ncbi:DNA-3-methyladenine glycosylase I [Lactiplantibacillus garii]|uniref:DNA-3-methyladenine glycosylase I n=1 Tax=Lactiplantibacillus garii TaxID=2306423 RepID=A0A426D5Y9_9LACO|nr:DNA-3-methyladenine glycosylase I [Lactiplantibacillus garii]RRK10010.1 DNA-3-methyladenine glycosylase I [Lactiplantibacillus garii]